MQVSKEAEKLYNGRPRRIWVSILVSPLVILDLFILSFIHRMVLYHPITFFKNYYSRIITHMIVVTIPYNWYDMLKWSA